MRRPWSGAMPVTLTLPVRLERRPRVRQRRLRRLTVGALIALAVALLAAGFWLPAKAELAQHLLNRAWQRTTDGDTLAKPWPWADTHPVARLTLPDSDEPLTVLAGASGRNLAFGPEDAEQASIFSDAEVVEKFVRKALPRELAGIDMQIDLPRHIYRPHTRKATAGQNFLFHAATGEIRPLTDDQLFRQLPVAHRMCRVYLRKDAPRAHAAAVGKALDELAGAGGDDDLTNM